MNRRLETWRCQQQFSLRSVDSGTNPSVNDFFGVTVTGALLSLDSGDREGNFPLLGSALACFLVQLRESPNRHHHVA